MIHFTHTTNHEYLASIPSQGNNSIFEYYVRAYDNYGLFSQNNQNYTLAIIGYGQISTTTITTGTSSTTATSTTTNPTGNLFENPWFYGILGLVLVISISALRVRSIRRKKKIVTPTPPPNP